MFVRVVKLWIIISALASVGGWALSAIGALNKWGYGSYFFAATVILVAFLCFNRHPLFSSWSPAADLKKLKRRMHRFLPASFGFLAALVFLSGILYAPTDHTAMSYRLPRVL